MLFILCNFCPQYGTPCISTTETLIILFKSPQTGFWMKGGTRTGTSTAFLLRERGFWGEGEGNKRKTCFKIRRKISNLGDVHKVI